MGVPKRLRPQIQAAEFSYQIEVMQAGEYSLSYRIASPKQTKGFKVIVDNKEITVGSIAKTGGYNEWETQKSGRIYLKEGKNKLIVKSLDNNWKLNWLTLQKD